MKPCRLIPRRVSGVSPVRLARNPPESKVNLNRFWPCVGRQVFMRPDLMQIRCLQGARPVAMIRLAEKAEAWIFEAAMTSKHESHLSRRQFLRRAATAAAVPLIVPGSVLGLRGAVAPSNRIVFGAIGVGNRARDTLPTFLAFPDIQYVAVCDCRADRLKSAKEIVDRHYGNPDCQAYEDFRDLLARKDVDAVSIATGNRWHGLGSIYAARAGKDIYCEKPVTLTIAEGRALVETCRRFGTIYQAGTQRRSTASYRFARGDGSPGQDRQAADGGNAGLGGAGHRAREGDARARGVELRHLAGANAVVSVRAGARQRVAVFLGHGRRDHDGHGLPLHRPDAMGA